MKTPSPNGFRNEEAGTPPILWIMVGFGAAYLWLFILPVFFSGPKMDVLVSVVPVMLPIGADLRQTLVSTQRVLLEGASPYFGNMIYPPLAFLFHGPFLLLSTPVARYGLISALTLIAFCGTALIFPSVMKLQGRVSPELLLIFVTGLMSYGLLFELERGQFNVIAASLAYAAIWLAQSNARFRWLWSGALLSLSMQLKLYPLMLFPAIVQDWHDWKHNARVVLGLVFVNLACLFVLGSRVSLEFVNAVRAFTGASQPDKIRLDNHSIYSFVGLVGQSLEARGVHWTELHQTLLGLSLLVLVGASVLFIILQAGRSGLKSFSPDVLLACAIAAIIIPGVSHDYTLPILAGPVAIYLADLGRRNIATESPAVGAALLAIFSFAYASLLFPLGYKPGILLLQNNLPALIMLLLLAAFAAWRWPRMPAAA